MSHSKCSMRGDLKNGNFIITSLFLNIFTPNFTSKYSPLTTTHFCKRFFHRSKHFLNSLIGMFFRPSSDFSFTSSTVAKRFSFISLFNLGKTPRFITSNHLGKKIRVLFELILKLKTCLKSTLPLLACENARDKFGCNSSQVQLFG